MKIWSEFQKTIFSFIEKGKGNCIVQAVAGSGKTTTLIESMNYIKGNAIFVAFNKSIADELSRRCPSNVRASTLHSFGNSCMYGSFGKYCKIDGKKIQYIMNEINGLAFRDDQSPQDKAMIFKARSQVSRLISLVKGTMTDVNNTSAIMELCEHYNIDIDPENLGLFRSAFSKSIDVNRRFYGKHVIDFDDMIYYPAAGIVNVNTTFDNIFVDECQDLNAAQISLILKMRKGESSRLFVVGDRYQSIYGFRGADIHAMDNVKKSLDAVELPLSICYRCPSSHITMAQDIVPDILPRPEAPDGEILHIEETDFVNNVTKDNHPLVLCRTNAPLVSFALQLIKQGYKAIIKGADIGNYIISLVKGFNVKTIPELLEKVDEWENQKLEQLTKRNASESAKLTIADYADVIRFFAEICKYPWDIESKVQSIFSDGNGDILLSTVHRAKGLEADSVYIVKPSKIPFSHPKMKDWEHIQESNLHYVALTRSKNKLVFVNEP